MVPYERLKAWQLCHELALAVYAVTDSWPKSESYGMTRQARRAVHSAAANIAEGSAKRGKSELRKYLDVTLGSLSELSYTLRLARDRGMISGEDWERLDKLRNHAGAVTWRLYESSTKKHSNAEAPDS
ncbi:MAG: four helix bundle protein [Gemmatimonadales bacterium]